MARCPRRALGAAGPLLPLLCALLRAAADTSTGRVGPRAGPGGAVSATAVPGPRCALGVSGWAGKLGGQRFLRLLRQKPSIISRRAGLSSGVRAQLLRPRLGRLGPAGEAAVLLLCGHKLQCPGAASRGVQVAIVWCPVPAVASECGRERRDIREGSPAPSCFGYCALAARGELMLIIMECPSIVVLVRGQGRDSRWSWSSFAAWLCLKPLVMSVFSSVVCALGELWNARFMLSCRFPAPPGALLWGS